VIDAASDAAAEKRTTGPGRVLAWLPVAGKPISRLVGPVSRKATCAGLLVEHEWKDGETRRRSELVNRKQATHQASPSTKRGEGAR
jgi:hypothetical protein